MSDIFGIETSEAETEIGVDAMLERELDSIRKTGHVTGGAVVDAVPEGEPLPMGKVEEATEKPSYVLRPLVASDMGAICSIISKIGIRQFKECFNLEGMKGEDGKMLDVEQIGFGVVFDAAGIIISNIPRAELEIQVFLAKVSGMNLADIQSMPFADYGEMIMEVVMKDDFQDFFKRVMKLFKR